MWMKLDLITEMIIPMVTVPKEKDVTRSNPVEENRESVPIAALRNGKVFAPLTFEGSCNRDLLETWLENSLIPQLQPGNIIIIDNATFHKGQSIREIVEEARCEIWYLLTRSPDLNKRCDPAAETAAKEP